MLLKNQSIYGLLVLWLGSIRMTVQGLVFDNAVYWMYLQGFIFNRLVVLALCVSTIMTLVPMVKEEIYEIIGAMQGTAKVTSVKESRAS